MRVLITGSREWIHADTLYKAMDVVLNALGPDEPLVLVHGGARGADFFAGYWARQWKNAGKDVTVEVHPARWSEHGNAAGPIRNQQMVDAGADLVLAFIRDNSPGASHLVRQARKAGIPVREYRENTEVEMTEETPTTLTLTERLVAVKKDIGAVGKGDRNSQQGFNFRGIDAVLNAVAGPLMKHGVVVYPSLKTIEKGTATTSKGSVMNTVIVTVEYVFTDGLQNMRVLVPGEAFDSGDKAVAKAMSVAYRTALIQALSLPTDEPDPDMDTYEASPQVPQLSNEDLLVRINEETSVEELKKIWPDQGLANRPEHLRKAIQDRAATLQQDQPA